MPTKINLQAFMYSALAVLMMAAWPHAAMAQATDMGSMVKSLVADIGQPVLSLVVNLSFLVGFYMVGSALYGLATGEGEIGDRLKHQIAKFIAAAFLCSVPDLMGVSVGTMWGGGGMAYGTSIGALGVLTDCTTHLAAGDAATCAAKNIGTNFVPAFLHGFFLLTKIGGVVIMISTINAMAASYGRNGQPVKGAMTKLVCASLMLNLSALMQAIASSLGIDSEFLPDGAQGLVDGTITSPPSLLAYANTGSGLLAQYQQLIGWCFVILTVFGCLAVGKGLTQLMHHAEGKGNTEEFKAGLLHLFGGVMLANGKITTCFILSTLMGNAMGFC